MNRETREWDDWCARYGIDPDTEDERMIDYYLRGVAPPVLFHRRRPNLREIDSYMQQRAELQWRDAAQRDVYLSWEDYDQATARLSPSSRDAQTTAEVFELNRWWRL